MSIPGKNAFLIRRIKLYAFGFVLGIFIVSFVYKGRGCQLPASMKMDELNAQKQEYSALAECTLKCRGITKAELHEFMKKAKVNYEESSVHKKPFATYAVETASDKGKQLRILIEDADTTTKITSVLDLSLAKDTCICE